MKELVMNKLDELKYPYDDFCINHIVNELQANNIDEDGILDEWLWYVKENLFD